MEQLTRDCSGFSITGSFKIDVGFHPTHKRDAVVQAIIASGKFNGLCSKEVQVRSGLSNFEWLGTTGPLSHILYRPLSMLHCAMPTDSSTLPCHAVCSPPHCTMLMTPHTEHFVSSSTPTSFLQHASAPTLHEVSRSFESSWQVPRAGSRSLRREKELKNSGSSSSSWNT